MKKLLFLDYETYYDKDYSLRKMTPAEYILDPRYETICCAVKWNNEKPFLVDGPDFPKFISGVDPSAVTTITFNALFDNCILAWRYGFVPRQMLCAMRMAAALRGHVLPGASLATVSKCLGVGTKGTDIENVVGLNRQAIIDRGLWPAFSNYAINDVELCAGITFRLWSEFPESERRVMDHVLRCCIQPEFKVDPAFLQAHSTDLANEKAALLLAAGITDPKQLRSNVKLSALLQSHGVEIEYKTSLTDPTRRVPAFAKTDEFMADLLVDTDPVIRALASARLGLRSTIEESRCNRMLAISRLGWRAVEIAGPPAYRGGNMPIPLRYSGAHTHRLSGDWKLNMQNLPAGRGAGAATKLRRALAAPAGYGVITADLAQIECRVNAWLCGQEDLLELFKTGQDPYSVLASKIFGFIVDKNLHKLERFIGKGGTLGLGFGCGDEKFYNMVVRDARKMGMDMAALMKVWTPELARTAVQVYRRTNQNICRMWRRLSNVLRDHWAGVGEAEVGPVKVGPGYVMLPNGMKMLYDVINKDPEDLRYRYGKRVHRMYGPKFLENIVQALARIILMNAALRLWDRGYKFKLQAHDELVFIAPLEDIHWRTKPDGSRELDVTKGAAAVILEEMQRPPSWAPDLPVKAELGAGATYGDSK
jgi:DNA polymerase